MSATRATFPYEADLSIVRAFLRGDCSINNPALGTAHSDLTSLDNAGLCMGGSRVAWFDSGGTLMGRVVAMGPITSPLSIMAMRLLNALVEELGGDARFTRE